MRSDDSAARMKTDRENLRAFLDGLTPGHRIKIDDWYAIAQRLGLGRSDRQRLSDMRAEGYGISFDFKQKEYLFTGWQGDTQPTLF